MKLFTVTCNFLLHPSSLSCTSVISDNQLVLSVHRQGYGLRIHWIPYDFPRGEGGGGVKAAGVWHRLLIPADAEGKKGWSFISRKAANVGPIVCCCDIAVHSLFCNLHKVYVNASFISRDVVRQCIYGTFKSQKEQTFRAPMGYIVFKVITLCSRQQLAYDRDRLTRVTLVCEITLPLDR